MLRGRVGSWGRAPVSPRAEDGDPGTARGRSDGKGASYPGSRTVPGYLSGRATSRVPSLSNSRSRRSQDLGVKVRRKKKLSCINVPMGGTTAPSHSLLTPPAWRQPINTQRPPSPARSLANGHRRGATPRGSETLPFPRPVFSMSNGDAEGVGLMPLLTRPRAPHPRPEPFIRPRGLNKGRAVPEGKGPGFQDLVPSHPPPTPSREQPLPSAWGAV